MKIKFYNTKSETTDDRFEKMAEKLDLKTRVFNPLRFAWGCFKC